MRKSVLFGLLSVMVLMSACKSKESAYKQAYEKAKAQENTEQVQVNAPVPVTPVATQTTENYDQDKYSEIEYNGGKYGESQKEDNDVLQILRQGDCR